MAQSLKPFGPELDWHLFFFSALQPLLVQALYISFNDLGTSDLSVTIHNMSFKMHKSALHLALVDVSEGAGMPLMEVLSRRSSDLSLCLSPWNFMDDL